VTPEEEQREAQRAAACEAHFRRRKPHEVRFEPVNGVTAYSVMPPPEVIEAITGEPLEREEPGAYEARVGGGEEAEGARAGRGGARR
jgi:hypothetical protein